MVRHLAVACDFDDVDRERFIQKVVEHAMDRFSETEIALLTRLRALKAKPEMAINLFDIGVPLSADGFSQDEMMAVLQALEQEKVIAFGPGNRISILRELPEG
jgi:tellurite resistance protein